MNIDDFEDDDDTIVFREDDREEKDQRTDNHKKLTEFPEIDGIDLIPLISPIHSTIGFS